MFGVIVVLTGTSSWITYQKVILMEETQNREIDLHVPTAQAGDRMLNGIDQSLAALRGFMILGDNPQKAELPLRPTI